MTQTRPPHIELDQAYGQLRTALQAYLQRQVGDVGTAEDLVQDVFVKALRAVKEDRAPRDLTAWLYQAARTTLIDYWRTRKPGSDIEPDELPASEDDDAVGLHRTLATCLRPMTERLPPRYRETLVAADFEGQRLKTLAEAEGVSVSAIKSRVSRGRGLLREQVLACCHVDMADGWVQDYYPRDPITAESNLPRQSGCVDERGAPSKRCGRPEDADH